MDGLIPFAKLKEKAGFDAKLSDFTGAMSDTEKKTACGRLNAMYKGELELIDEIALAEDVIEIQRTAEPNGTPYNFKRVWLLMTTETPADGSVVSTYLRLERNDVPSLDLELLYNVAQVGKKVYTVAYYETLGQNAYRIYKCVGTTLALNDYTTRIGNETYYKSPITNANIEKISFNTTGSSLFKAGTNLKIWGERA